MPRFHPIALLVFGGMTSAAIAQDNLERGRMLLEENCSGCHSVVAEGGSPLAAAPPFRSLGARYPVADLEEALAEGILTGHPSMPQLSFEPQDVEAIIAYIQSLQGD